MDVLVYGLVFGLLALALWGASQTAGNRDRATSASNVLTEAAGGGRPVIAKTNPMGNVSGVGLGIESLFIIRDGEVLELSRSALLAVELITDGQTVTKISRSGQVAGGLVGAMIAGPAGAIIGGLSASRTQAVAVSKQVCLRLLIADEILPTYTLDFIEMTNTGSTHGAVAMSEAEEWLARFRVVIDSNSREAPPA